MDMCDNVAQELEIGSLVAVVSREAIITTDQMSNKVNAEKLRIEICVKSQNI